MDKILESTSLYFAEIFYYVMPLSLDMRNVSRKGERWMSACLRLCDWEVWRSQSRSTADEGLCGRRHCRQPRPRHWTYQWIPRLQEQGTIIYYYCYTVSQKTVQNFASECLGQKSTNFNNIWCMKSWVNYAYKVCKFSTSPEKCYYTTLWTL